MTFGLDLPSVRAMVDDYRRVDLWAMVERPPTGTTLHLVVGDRSRVWTVTDRQRALTVAARSGGRVAVDLLDAGHWVNVDDPDGILRVLLDATASVVEIA